MRQLKHLSLLLGLLLLGPSTYAQSVRFQSQAISSRGAGIANATVAVCSQPANTNTQPCSPLATLATSTSTTSGGANPLTADSFGNFFFYAAPGRYTVQIYGPAVSGQFVTPDVEVGSVAGGSAGTFTNLTVSGTTNATGDLLAASGRPWIDVMGKGAKNDNSTDDTAAIQSAITAACAFSPTGAVVYFPRGAGYKTANTSTTPFIIPASCVGITFRGSGWSTADVPEPPSTILGPNLTTSMFSVPNALNGLVRFEELGISGNPASATAVGISVTANTSGVINHVFFDQWGGSAINITGLFGWWIDESWAQNCLEVRPASTDTGCFDLSNNDNELHANFVTTSSGTAAGNIGTGHSYAYAIRGSNGFYRGNQGELSQHGWLVTGNDNTLIGNRATLNQGNGFHCQGQNNIFVGNKALNNSQTATGSFDGFLNDGTCVGGIFADSIIDDPGGNGNHTRHGFTDANSNGGTYTLANHYSNNHFGHLGTPTGVLYNMTGTSPYAIQQPHASSGFLGDVSITIQAGIDFETQVFNTVLTANRTVTLSTTGAWQGARFRIVRTSGATGAFTLTVGGSVNLPPGSYVDFEFSQAQWNPVSGGNTVTGIYAVSNLLISATAPTIAAAGCGGSAASMVVTNGTAAFKVNVGTAPTSACTFTFPAATTGWNVTCNDITTQSTAVFVQKQTGVESTTSVTITNFNDVAVATAFVASDILKCTASAD